MQTYIFCVFLLGNILKDSINTNKLCSKAVVKKSWASMSHAKTTILLYTGNKKRFLRTFYFIKILVLTDF